MQEAGEHSACRGQIPPGSESDVTATSPQASLQFPAPALRRPWATAPSLPPPSTPLHPSHPAPHMHPHLPHTPLLFRCTIPTCSSPRSATRACCGPSRRSGTRLTPRALRLCDETTACWWAEWQSRGATMCCRPAHADKGQQSLTHSHLVHKIDRQAGSPGRWCLTVPPPPAPRAGAQRGDHVSGEDPGGAQPGGGMRVCQGRHLRPAHEQAGPLAARHLKGGWPGHGSVAGSR